MHNKQIFFKNNTVYFNTSEGWLQDELPTMEIANTQCLFNQGQLDIVSLFLQHDKGFILNEPQTGKTAGVIYSVDLLQRIDKSKGVLILAPLGAIREGGWLGEAKHVVNRELVNLRNPKLKGRLPTVTTEDILISNFTSMHKYAEPLLALVKKGIIDTIIIDELNEFASNGSAHFKFVQHAHKLNIKLNTKLKVYGLTGTKSADSLKRLDQTYAEVVTVLGPRVFKNLSTFRETYGVKTHFNYIMDANKQPVLRDLYQPKSEFKLSALRTDMERKYFLHEIPYSDAQRKYHNLVKNRLLGFKHDELLMTQHAPAARIDVFSIASGVLSVRNEVGEKTGQILKIDARDKKRKLLQVIDKALNGKALILISLLEVIQDVADYLFRNGIKFALITGAINSAKVRDNICNAFNKDPQLRVIIASPKSVSYNTRLGGMCNTVIWYGGNMTGYVAYKQASDRMNATAHKEIHVHHIVSTPSSGQGFDYISLQREMKSLDIKEFYKSMQISSDY